MGQPSQQIRSTSFNLVAFVVLAVVASTPLARADSDFSDKVKCKFDPKMLLNVTDLSQPFIMDCESMDSVAVWVVIVGIVAVPAAIAVLYGLALGVLEIKSRCEARRDRARLAAANDYMDEALAHRRTQRV